MQHAHDSFPPVTFNEFVDDLAQRVDGVDEDETIEIFANASIAVADGLNDLRLTVSGKSVMLASSEELLHKTAERIRTKGKTIKVAKVGRDLGLSAAGGRRRTTLVTSIRAVKVKRRAKRANDLHRWSGRKATKMYTAGLAPAQAYGLESHGAAPSTLKKRRATAAKLSPCSRHFTVRHNIDPFGARAAMGPRRAG